MNSLTKVNICNMALAVIGSEPILDISEDSKLGNALSRFYDPARQAVLEEGEWSFALKHFTLNLSADDNETDYAYMYVLPADCITPVMLEGYDNYTFEIMGDYLYSNLPDAVLKYVWNIEDTTKFSPGFARALAHRLASDLAVYFKDKDAANYLQLYMLELRKALGKNVQYRRNNKMIKYPIEYTRFQERGY